MTTGVKPQETFLDPTAMESATYHTLDIQEAAFYAIRGFTLEIELEWSGGGRPRGLYRFRWNEELAQLKTQHDTAEVAVHLPSLKRKLNGLKKDVDARIEHSKRQHSRNGHQTPEGEPACLRTTEAASRS